MVFKLLEVHNDDEFIELFQVFRAAFTDPGTKLWPLFSGDRGKDALQSKAALNETVQRFVSWHRADPSSHWLKVIEDSTGKVVGGGRWALHEQGNPYDGQAKTEAYWWPAGKPRELATTCLNQFLATAVMHANRPHVCTSMPIRDDQANDGTPVLNILFTHPEYRRQGVATLILQWGLAHAEKLGLDAYVEATAEGKPSYERFGFRDIDVNELTVPNGDDSQEAKEVGKDLLPMKWWSMLRPAK